MTPTFANAATTAFVRSDGIALQAAGTRPPVLAGHIPERADGDHQKQIAEQAGAVRRDLESVPVIEASTLSIFAIRSPANT